MVLSTWCSLQREAVCIHKQVNRLGTNAPALPGLASNLHPREGGGEKWTADYMQF